MNKWRTTLMLVAMVVALLAVACTGRSAATETGPAVTELGTGLPAGATEVSTPGEVPPTRATETPSAPLPTEIKVATWNLGWLNAEPGKGNVRRTEADYARLRRYAERLDADVIALQEVDGPEAAARVFDSQHYELHISHRRGPQLTGFAVRRGLSVHRHPDLQALDVGGVRHGTDITLELGAGHRIQLLAVHLKSGCFDKPLASPGRACQKLAAQLPVLERWIDARAAEGTPSMVLGDFNRRLFARPGGDGFWKEIDDGQPPQADLDSPTDNRSARCWNGKYPKFIDHLVYDRAAAAMVVPGSFEQHLYDAADAAHARVLSDHCPLSIRLRAGAAGGTARGDQDARTTEGGDSDAREIAPSPGSDHAGAPPAIKGNISRDGRRLYHLPECPSYAATRISEDKGERWFATEAQAREAGWEKASNCP